MKLIFTVLKLYALCLVLSFGLMFFITPAEAWGTFGQSTEGQYLLTVHVLKALSGVGTLSVLLTGVLGLVGLAIDRMRPDRIADIAPLPNRPPVRHSEH